MIFPQVLDFYPYNDENAKGLTMKPREINHRFYVAFIVLVSLYLGVPSII